MVKFVFTTENPIAFQMVAQREILWNGLFFTDRSGIWKIPGRRQALSCSSRGEVHGFSVRESP